MPKKSKIVIMVVALMGLLQPLFAQQDIIAEYADTSSSRRAYCFYPSTLRMLNVSKSEDFALMVKDIEKLVVYTLDSTAKAAHTFRPMLKQFKELGYEEYGHVWGGGINVEILGIEDDTPQLVGVFQNEGDLYAFYLLGVIDFMKIPSLLQNFESGDMINIFGRSGMD